MKPYKSKRIWKDQDVSKVKNDKINQNKQKIEQKNTNINNKDNDKNNNNNVNTNNNANTNVNDNKIHNKYQQNEAKQKIKIVLLGDDKSGKTSLFTSYCCDKFQSQYFPTIFDTFQVNIKKKNQNHCLQIWDTSGNQQFKKIRQLSYTRGDIFLICFSLNDKKQFKSATHKWYKQIKQYNENPLIVFIGTKCDLIDQINPKDMLNTQMELLDKIKIQDKIKNIGYQCFYCSAITQDGLNKIFDKAVDMVAQNKKNQLIINIKQNQSKTINKQYNQSKSINKKQNQSKSIKIKQNQFKSISNKYNQQCQII